MFVIVAIPQTMRVFGRCLRMTLCDMLDDGSYLCALGRLGRPHVRSLALRCTCLEMASCSVAIRLNVRPTLEADAQAI